MIKVKFSIELERQMDSMKQSTSTSLWPSGPTSQRMLETSSLESDLQEWLNDPQSQKEYQQWLNEQEKNNQKVNDIFSSLESNFNKFFKG